MARPIASARALLALAVAVVPLAGCPREAAVTFCNHTGHDAVIAFVSGPSSWRAGECVRSDYYDKTRFRWEAIPGEDVRVPVLDVRTGSERAEYRLRLFPLPERFVPETGGVAVVLQLEPDSRLYVVDAGGGLPTPQLPPQPDGYPIAPANR